MTTHIELYEALKPHVGDEGARLISEVVPAAENLATRTDLQDLRAEMRTEFGGMRSEMREFRAEMKAEFAEFKAETRDWMLRYFVPLWIGVYGTLGAVVVALVIKG